MARWRTGCAFHLLVVEKVRERLNDKLLLYRLGSDDLAPNGTHIEDSIAFAEKAGASRELT